MNYPLIVKHYNGYSSIGMTKDSRCPNAEQLRVMARKMIAEFGGALIEVCISCLKLFVLSAFPRNSWRVVNSQFSLRRTLTMRMPR